MAEKKNTPKERLKIWNEIHNKDITILTSDNKKYKINVFELLRKKYKKLPPAVYSGNSLGERLSLTMEGRTRHPRLGVRRIRKIKKSAS
jgi:hypothetical protein